MVLWAYSLISLLTVPRVKGLNLLISSFFCHEIPAFLSLKLMVYTLTSLLSLFKSPNSHYKLFKINLTFLLSLKYFFHDRAVSFFLKTREEVFF